ncbi:flocculation-associated PEP-CTERM protein PepA [Roseateles amylovorans]|uniref:Flocculation-associated PEP-CTERM protein PepA n=1 Tax=Roseateles amylovorans TaxID=2978473 RepID=A0ABY6BBK2_9BURK|nr:flocculation-associated PEP-CTERM protein PepA [Roseateles amylovorans]UXH80572.1 flocculation-associated PEP-CTERM protein PepA [Roseateles amylovorans]
MTLPMLSRQSTGVQRTLLALALAAASASASALPAFTWDPTAAGLNGAAFTADNLLISNYSTVTFGASDTFTETGYLTVSAAQLGGGAVLPTGLNSTYGLYIQFTGTGTLTTNGAPGTTATLGKLDTLSYTLYGYNGSASFGVTGKTPTETATGEIALASGTLKFGNVATVPSGDGTTFNPSANASLTANWLAPGFFADPSVPYTVALTSFSNTTSQVTPFADGTGFSISQGGGSINFATPVPEPASYAMLLCGLAAIGFVARRRNRGEK